MSRRVLARLAVGLAALAGTVALTGAPANAAFSVAGNCATSGYEGWGVAYYTISGNLTYWDRFAVEQLYAGNKTIVFVRVMRERAGADQLAWGPGKVSNLAHDTPKDLNPPGTIQTHNSLDAYVTFQFRFDKNNASDPECYARTRNT
jgi:hypothetical protein